MARKAFHHWYQLYQSVHPKIDAHQGEESIYSLIRREADASGYDEKVFKRMLNAGAFLERIAVGPFAVEQVKCGYAHIELLERLYRLNSQEAQTRLNAVLENKVTLKELRESVELIAAESGHAQTNARSRARQRVAEHQRLCTKLTQQAGSAFFGNLEGELVLVKKFRILRQFILINDPEQPIAIIPRLGDSSMKESQAAEELLKLALSVRRYFHRIWLVLPSDSLLAQEVVARADQVGAFESWLYLAIPNEDLSTLIPYRNRRRLLEKDLDGEDDCAWEGVSLRDGHKLSGSLNPI
jgi:hypothetical protein